MSDNSDRNIKKITYTKLPRPFNINFFFNINSMFLYKNVVARAFFNKMTVTVVLKPLLRNIRPLSCYVGS